MRRSTQLLLLALAASAAAMGISYLLSLSDAQPQVVTIDRGVLYDPVRAGEEPPDGYRQSLFRDAIPPIYEPEFVAASDAGWADDTLVVGLEIDGDARAYPVGYLNRREIVNDHVGKTPVLVTW